MATDQTGQGRVGRGITDHLYVDVDDTLIFRDAPEGRVNWPLVEEIKQWYWRRRADGAFPCVVIWTMGGETHAAAAAVRCNLDASSGFRTICIAKPDLMVDNGGQDWFYKRFRVVKPEAFTCPKETP